MFGIAVNAIMEPSALQTIHTVPIAMFISVVADVELGAVPTQEHSAPQARKGYYTIVLSGIARLSTFALLVDSRTSACNALLFISLIRLWQFRTMLVAHIGDHAGARSPLARCRSTQFLFRPPQFAHGSVSAVKLTAGALPYDSISLHISRKLRPSD